MKNPLLYIARAHALLVASIRAKIKPRITPTKTIEVFNPFPLHKKVPYKCRRLPNPAGTKIKKLFDQHRATVRNP